jgi:hypothetical protein
MTLTAGLGLALDAAANDDVAPESEADITASSAAARTLVVQDLMIAAKVRGLLGG